MRISFGWDIKMRFIENIFWRGGGGFHDDTGSDRRLSAERGMEGSGFGNDECVCEDASEMWTELHGWCVCTLWGVRVLSKEWRIMFDKESWFSAWKEKDTIQFTRSTLFFNLDREINEKTISLNDYSRYIFLQSIRTRNSIFTEINYKIDPPSLLTDCIWEMTILTYIQYHTVWYNTIP